ncbi:MAG: hypothetical protein E4G94_03200 [ANME-2 cluster archaeon]|nr:MAG: hypothetical protein E4G94_03200 [ANME-2 cluster archaeon]
MTADQYHGKEGVLQIEYPRRIQFKDVTTSTNDHYAYKAAAATIDADPNDGLATEYSDANYQTIGVDNTITVDQNSSTNTYYSRHYFKILSSATSALVTRIEAIIHGTSNQGGALADGWTFYIWDATNDTWDSQATTTNATETVLEADLTSATTTTITNALADSDFIYLCAESAAASDGSSASNMNVAFVEVKFWYATTIAVTKGWEAKIVKEIDELFGQDSILRQDVVQRNVRVECSFDRAKFDGVLMSEIMGTIDMDQDVDGSTDAGRSRASIKDTSKPLTVTFRGTVTSGSNSLVMRVDNVALAGLNFTAPENEWMIQNFSGNGNAAYLEYAT